MNLDLASAYLLGTWFCCSLCIDNGLDIICWIGRNTPPAALNSLFGVQSMDHVQIQSVWQKHSTYPNDLGFVSDRRKWYQCHRARFYQSTGTKGVLTKKTDSRTTAAGCLRNGICQLHVSRQECVRKGLRGLLMSASFANTDFASIGRSGFIIQH